MSDIQIIIDPSVKVLLESIRLAPAREFWCDRCQTKGKRKDVTKKGGEYFCLYCTRKIVTIFYTGGVQS